MTSPLLPCTSARRVKSSLLAIASQKKRLNFFTFLDAEYDVEPGFRIEGIGRIQRNDSRYFMGKWLYGSLSIEVVEKRIQEKNYHYALSRVRSLIVRAVTYGITGDPE